MADDLIGYTARTQNALLGVVRDVLADTAKKGLPGEHHFYISFATTYSGVVISARLRQNHPEEMTIVLQNQYEDLGVTDDSFTVRLSFNQHPETLIVPIKAITRFYDPAVSFGLMFNDFDVLERDDKDLFDMLDDGFAEPDLAEEPYVKQSADGEIVSLDAFRKNKD